MPWQGSDPLARGHYAGGHDTEIANRAANCGVERIRPSTRATSRPKPADGDNRERDGHQHREGVDAAHEEEQQREHEVEVRLDGDDEHTQFEVGAWIASCSSRQWTRTDVASGTATPGCGTISQATSRLKTRAAQYQAGGFARPDAGRTAARKDSSRQPDRAGEMASERPEGR